MTTSSEQTATSIDGIKQRYVDEIRLRGYDDKYIDRNEEREILQIALQQGLGLDAARAALAEVCGREGFVLETTLTAKIKERCEAALANDGTIDQREFDHTFATIKQLALGRKNDREIKRLIVTVMEDHALNKVKASWFFNWYVALKRELGLT